jgi:hypothetical protein
MTTYEFPAYLLADNQMNATRLLGELRGALDGLDVFLARRPPAGMLLVTVPRMLTTDEMETVSRTISQHESDARHLPTLKSQKFAAIDRKTAVVIGRGFQFMGVMHSLSDNAQKNLLGMFSLRDDPAMQYPIKFNSKDDMSDTVISNADEVRMMYLTATGTIMAAWGSGTALKERVRAATTPEEVNAIEDTR